MINDIDNIITNSIKYIANTTHAKVFDVMNTYLRAYEKESARYAFIRKKLVDEALDEHIKTYALQVAGRYHRRYEHHYRH